MRKILDLLFLAAIAKAVTFRVVAPGATDVQVSVNGQLTKLTASDPDVPYFTGDANASPDSKYKVLSLLTKMDPMMERRRIILAFIY